MQTDKNNKTDKPYLWFIWSILLTLSFLIFIPLQYFIPDTLMVLSYVLLAIGWIIPLIFTLSGAEKFIATVRELRTTAPLVLWLLTLLLFIIMMLIWGIFTTAEYNTYLLIFFIFIAAIFWYAGSQAEDWRIIGTLLEKSRWTNLFIIITTILLTLAPIELFMRWTKVETNGFTANVQSLEWFKRYFLPINSIGLRAYEPVFAGENQESILIVGDSFAAGYGIDHIDDVFAYQTGEILGEAYVINLLGQPGASPTVEMLDYFDYQTDILVLSHYVNDIEISAPETIYHEFKPHPFFNWWIKRYFLASYAYWNIYVSGQMSSQYTTDLHSMYENDEIWSLYQENLQAFIDWSDEHETSLIVLIWPMLDNMDISADANLQVAEFFEERGIPTVQMRQELQDLLLQERIVSRFDSHPSLQSHRIAAEALTKVILSSED